MAGTSNMSRQRRCKEPLAGGRRLMDPPSTLHKIKHAPFDCLPKYTSFSGSSHQTARIPRRTTCLTTSALFPYIIDSPGVPGLKNLISPTFFAPPSPPLSVTGLPGPYRTLPNSKQHGRRAVSVADCRTGVRHGKLTVLVLPLRQTRFRRNPSQSLRGYLPRVQERLR